MRIGISWQGKMFYILQVIPYKILFFTCAVNLIISDGWWWLFSCQLNFPKDMCVRQWNGKMQSNSILSLFFLEWCNSSHGKACECSFMKMFWSFSPCFTLSSVWKARKFSCNFYFDCFITITYISVTAFIIINNKFCEVGLAKINVSFF